MTLVETDYNQLLAALGDLKHKRAVFEHFLSLSPAVHAYFDRKHQAAWLKRYFKALVPAPENGVPPSDHRVSSAFELHFEISPQLRQKYLSTLPATPGVPLGFNV